MATTLPLVAVPLPGCFCQDDSYVDAPLRKLSTDRGLELVIPLEIFNESVPGTRHEFYVDHQRCQGCAVEIFKVSTCRPQVADRRGPLGYLPVHGHSVDAQFMPTHEEHQPLGGSTDLFSGPWNVLSGTHLETQPGIPEPQQPAPLPRQQRSSFRTPTGQPVPSRNSSRSSDWQDVPYKRRQDGRIRQSPTNQGRLAGIIDSAPDFTSPNPYTVIAERMPGSINPPRSVPTAPSDIPSSSTGTTPSGKGHRFRGEPYKAWHFSLYKKYQSWGFRACDACKQKRVMCRLSHLDAGVLARVPDHIWKNCPIPAQLRKELLADADSHSVDNRVMQMINHL